VSKLKNGLDIVDVCNPGLKKMKSKLDSESEEKINLKIKRIFRNIKAKQRNSEGTDMFWMNPQMKKT